MNDVQHTMLTFLLLSFTIMTRTTDANKGNVEPSRKNQANRPSTYKKRPASLDHYTCDMNLNILARKVEVAKAHNGGVTPYGAISKIVKEMKGTLPWVTTQMVRFHMRKLNKEERNAETMPPVAAGDTGDSTLSTLTLSCSGPGNTSNTVLQEASVPATAEANSHSSTTTTITSVLGTYYAPADDKINVIGGRPKGSTQCNVRDVNRRVKLAITEAASAYRTALDKMKEEKSGVLGSINPNHVRLPRGELKSIIASAKNKYHVEDVEICESTIRSRHKRNKLNPVTTQGRASPMAPFEPYLIEVILQLAKMRVPINATTGLHLANSMIEGTTLARDLARWKLKHNIQTRSAVPRHMLPTTLQVAAEQYQGKDKEVLDSATQSADSAAVTTVVTTATMHARTNEAEEGAGWQTTPPERLGLGYWNGFMKRNRHIIRSKRSVKFESKRAEWCTYENFSVMYDEVYSAMVETSIASKLDTKVMLDKSGEIVEHAEEAFGLPTQYIIQRPDKLVFVDKVGSNTSTTKDGNVGGEKFLCQANARPQVKAATADSHFTVLGFTAATGEPVMCAIIFSAKEMCESWVMSFNPSADWIG